MNALHMDNKMCQACYDLREVLLYEANVEMVPLASNCAEHEVAP